ncbi:uncharacterized protein EV154DRAFT_556556 [Mucor mucedo]|uniref:uncharacterized protein n=1 Tax=Mucor mucedo TaxID=29922 RepID=UPI00221F3097|nr:uncharacterized protein EV154DRAFT_556556 [Mucor mucedo]KAI7871407.1 hypothetical protein EV154DRAFT_556556 [Mucor mucedo]
MNSNFSDIDVTMPYVITSVVLSFYKNIMSDNWTPTRYHSFLSCVESSILAAQNRNPYILLNSLRLIETYMINMQGDNLALLESEYSIFVAAFRISQKFNDDFFCNHLEIDHSLLTEMNYVQLKQFEFKFLEKINYKILMPLEEYVQWKDKCQSIYVTSITPTILDNDVHYYFQENSFVGLLNSDVDCTLYQVQDSIPSPPSSVISKNDLRCDNNGLFAEHNIVFQYGF